MVLVFDFPLQGLIQCRGVCAVGGPFNVEALLDVDLLDTQRAFFYEHQMYLIEMVVHHNRNDKKTDFHLQ